MTAMKPALIASTAALAALLSACGGGGGGGGGGLSSTPTPPPTPSVTNAQLLSPAPGNGTLASYSESVVGPIYPGVSTGVPELGGFNGLQLRYDQATNRYEVLGAGNSVWQTILRNATGTLSVAANSLYQTINITNDTGGSASPYSSSGILSYGALDNNFSFSTLSGNVAYGIATPSGGIPVSGSATYSGQLAGHASLPNGGGSENSYSAIMTGSLDLSVNFASGGMSGSVTPSFALVSGNSVSLATMLLGNFNYASGQGSFSGSVVGAPAGGSNLFAGQFTGPAAQEAIGRIAFPFNHAGGSYQAAGVWIAKR